MNYLRGAVNAISAPYQYYKELPPLNPSTLTGAIDVIVIQRPADDGGTELVCSPFHVRFGKWQVLRPGEKKVDVSVNGHPIPYHMKIGEAGEAFFVFETDDDIPDELITSPIIQPVELQESQNVSTGAFGARDASDSDSDMPREQTTPRSQEPEFLDLNDSNSAAEGNPSMPTDDAISDDGSFMTKAKDVKEKPAKLSLQTPSQAGPSSHSYPTPDASPPPSVTPSTFLEHTGSASDNPRTVDDLLDEANEANDQLPTPGVQYRHNVALDVEGYHSRVREPSEETIMGSDRISFPGSSGRSSSSSSSASTPQPSRSPSPQPQRLRPHSLAPTNIYRATSEPPPDADEPGLSVLTQPPSQEYSWEWGAFPQPSPVQPRFTIGNSKDQSGTWSFGRRKARRSLNRSGSEDKGKGRMHDATIEEAEGTYYSSDADAQEDELVRCKSVPPELDGSPTLQRKDLPPDATQSHILEDRMIPDFPRTPETPPSGYGAGGILAPVKSDTGRLIVILDGKKSEFELSIVPGENIEDSLLAFNGRDEVYAAEVFSEGQVQYHRFLEDDSVVSHPGLVIRWAGDAYITRDDGSPLMDALVLWRDAALRERALGIATRPVSPNSDIESPLQSDTEDDDDGPSRLTHNRSKSLPPEKPKLDSKKPSSSSWVRWWSRSRNQEQSRPELREAMLTDVKPDQEGTPSKPISKDSVPAAPAPAPEHVPAAPRKKFAKTLRLTSDQLRALNLRMGANTITFSLSTSGAIACTAQIFVWDHSDFVVISDIDGTITKSDALGHVFTMIGRDWTHSGVAKLYTDITRNGYKIMYLTSRAIGQADSTRDYLKGIKQDQYQLPDGPVIMSPDRLMASLHREVIMRKPEVFKMACLRDIRRLFGEASRNPFYAGFGNRITDALSYRSVDVPSARIFTIDSTGEVKMELLELAGYKSSYIHMTDLVDQMFPPINRKWAPEFTDFNYWKAPMQEFPLPDLSPPSPALSARSDTSTIARIRNFSLVSGRRDAANKAINDTKEVLPTYARDKSSTLRQMSSFERLSNTLSNFTRSSSPDSVRRSASPESTFSYHEQGSEEESDHDNRRGRRQSVSSMPGSLDDMHFGVDEEEDEGEDIEAYGHEEDGEEEPDDAAFDEDLMLAGEMKNVPFL